MYLVRRFLTRKRCGVAFLAAFLIWAGSSGFAAWKLVHRQRPLFPEALPVVHWASVEEHRLATADGQDLGAWLVRGSPQHGVVLLLHGNGGSRSANLDLLRLIADDGFTVLALSLRCHGDSTGEVNDFGWSARQDVISAVEFLEREFPDRPVFVVARSLGAAAAIFAARDLGNRVAGYFLEQPYKDLASATWNRLENRLPVGFCPIAYCGLRLWTTWMLPVNASRISPVSHIADIPAEARILIIAGSTDKHARLSDVLAVHERIKDQAQLVVFDGAAHQPLLGFDRQRYAETLRGFLSTSPSTTPFENQQD